MSRHAVVLTVTDLVVTITIVLGHAVSVDAQLQMVQVLDSDATVFSTPIGLNTAGRIAGEGQISLQSPENQPLTWSDGVATALPLLQGDEYGRALSLDSKGTLVGESADVVVQGTTAHLTRHAVRWDGGHVLPLANEVTAGDALELLSAVDIDDAGRIIGEGKATPEGPTRGWLLSKGLLTDLGSIAPGGAMIPSQIGAFGRVVGHGVAADGWDHAFVWQDGVLHDLNDTTQGIIGSRAFDLDASGRIVGSAEFIINGELRTFAALWKPDGTIVNLGHVDIPDEIEPPGQDTSEARGINALGDIVGISQDYGHGTTGFLWHDGTMHDLNDLVTPSESGFVIFGATDIDDTGRILAFGGTTVPKALLLVPDQAGGYVAYGAGCVGSGDVRPVLGGLGSPSPGQTAGVSVTVGLGGAKGLLLVGSSNLALPFKGGCTLDIAPLLSVIVPLTLPGVGAGNGTLVLPVELPASAPSVALFLQAAFADQGAGHGVSLTNALRMSIL